jgi:hypothetical protein
MRWNPEWALKSCPFRKRNKSNPFSNFQSNEREWEVQQETTAMSELDGYAEDTKDKIAGLIAKPKASVKLLKKPPFRFLYDVVTAIGKASGYCDGLYSQDWKGVKAYTAPDKLNWLNRVILCASIASGKDFSYVKAKVRFLHSLTHSLARSTSLCAFLCTIVLFCMCFTYVSYCMPNQHNTTQHNASLLYPPARTGHRHGQRGQEHQRPPTGGV